MTDVADPERALSIAYAPAESRRALAALWALDERLGGIVRSTSEPLIGQMRLTWWHDAIGALDEGPPPAEPLLVALAEIAAPARLLPLIDGWELLLEPLPLDAAQLAAYADGRGATLFEAAATLLGGEADDRVKAAGRGWALVDLAFHVSDRAMGLAALDAAREAFADAPARWPGRLRAIGMLARLAERDAAAGLDLPRRPGAPLRLLRALRHRLTGG